MFLLKFTFKEPTFPTSPPSPPADLALLAPLIINIDPDSMVPTNPTNKMPLSPPTSCSRNVYSRRLRLPNELLYELVQCMPMAGTLAERRAQLQIAFQSMPLGVYIESAAHKMPPKRQCPDCDDMEGEVAVKNLELSTTNAALKEKEQLINKLLEKIAILESNAAASNNDDDNVSSLPVSAVRDKAAMLRNVDTEFGERILATLVETTGTRLADIAGNDDAKTVLEECVVLPSLNPALFTGLRAPSKGILLFGPPGNGKTMLAKAVAEESSCSFFSIAAATIMSKWIGEGERTVQALFKVARNAQPSIIFIDEIDSMLCERSAHEHEAERRVKTEFLVQMDGCTSATAGGKSDERILVLAATNRPQDLDAAILRRFEQRILIDLPGQGARAKMIERTFEMHKTKVQLSDEELDCIATKTEDYSYSDLMALCRSAAMMPVKSVPREKLRAFSADELRPVTVMDLDEALQSVKPSINLENRRKVIEFAGGHARTS